MLKITKQERKIRRIIEVKAIETLMIIYPKGLLFVKGLLSGVRISGPANKQALLINNSKTARVQFIKL